MEEEGNGGKRKKNSLDPETERKIAFIKADPSKYPVVSIIYFLYLVI
jgi:hypothetical protein